MLKFSQETNIKGVNTIRVVLTTVINAKVKKLDSFFGVLHRLFTSIKKDLKRLKAISKKIDMSYVTPKTKKRVEFETKKRVEFETKRKVDRNISLSIKKLENNLSDLTTVKQKIQEKLEKINDTVQKFIDEHPKEKATISKSGRKWGPVETVNISKMVKIANSLSDTATNKVIKGGIKKLTDDHNKCKKEIKKLENDVNEVSKNIEAMEKLLEK